MTRIGRYDVVEKIAAGGMAEIFSAHLVGAEGFRRPVIVKQMLPALAADRDAVKMFLDEGRLGALLNHDNIVRVLELGEHEGNYFIAMERVDGPTVADFARHGVARGRPMSCDVAAYIVARAADGLHYAHVHKDESGQPLRIVHRDVSPHNILLSVLGDVKVADFGVARADMRSSTTRSGVVRGTISYMSPEQVRAEPLDGRSDVFSLGVVLHELLCRKRLFEHDSDLVTMQRITEWTPPKPSERSPDVDAALDDIVARALAKERDQRTATARDLSDALDRWLRARPQFEGKRTLERAVSAVHTERARVDTDMPRTPLEARTVPGTPARRTPISVPGVTPLGSIALKKIAVTPKSAPAVAPVTAPVVTAPAVQPPRGFELLHAERALGLASFGDAFLILINGEVSTETFKNIGERELPFLRAKGRAVVITVLKKPGKMVTLPAEARRAASELSEAARPFTKLNCMCVLGSGFWVATARALFASIVYFQRTNTTAAKTLGSIDETVVYAADFMEPAPHHPALKAALEALGAAVDAKGG